MNQITLTINSIIINNSEIKFGTIKTINIERYKENINLITITLLDNSVFYFYEDDEHLNETLHLITRIF